MACAELFNQLCAFGFDIHASNVPAALKFERKLAA
jgi:hypothetical protein